MRRFAVLPLLTLALALASTLPSPAGGIAAGREALRLATFELTDGVIGATAGDSATLTNHYGVFGIRALTGAADEKHRFVLRQVLSVLSPDGTSVASIGTETPCPEHQGPASAPLVLAVSGSWDGRDDAGRTTPSGLYGLRLSARLVRIDEKLRGRNLGQTTEVLVAEISPVAAGSVLVDREPPTLALTSPATSFIADARPLVTFSFADPSSGVDPSSFSCDVNGEPFTGRFSISGDEAQWQVAEPLADGLYLLGASVADHATNRSELTTYFSVDTAPPTITLEPADGAVLTARPTTLRATYEDSGSGVCPRSVRLTLDGADVTSWATVGAAEVVVTVPADHILADGAHTWTADLTDRSGNPAAGTATFTISASTPTEPPTATIAFPTNGSTLAEGSRTILGHIRVPGGLAETSLALDGQPVALRVDVDRVEADVVLVAGEHTVRLTVRDLTGQSAFDEVHVTVLPDMVEPEVRPHSGWLCGVVHDATTNSPLQGVRVSLRKVPGAVLSDAQGRFAFPTDAVPPSGEGRVYVDLSASGYLSTQRDARVILDRETALAPVHLLPLDPATTVLGPAGGVAQSSDGRVQLAVPSGCLDAPVEIRATFLPSEETLPGFLPPTSAYTCAVDLKPDGLTFPVPVTLRVRNDRRIAPGTVVPVGWYDPERRLWVPCDSGVVTDDALWLECSISHFSAYDLNYPMELPADLPRPDVEEDASVDEQTPEEATDCGSRISLLRGDVAESRPFVGHRSMGRQRALELTYSSGHAAPTALVDVRLRPRTAGDVASSVTGNLTLGGITTTFGGLPSAEQHSLHLHQPALNRSGDYLPTGFHRFQYHAWYEFAPAYYATAARFGDYPQELLLDVDGNPIARATRVAALAQGEVVVVNRRRSAFGVGWSLGGLARIIDSTVATGPLLLQDGRSALGRWEPAQGRHRFAGNGLDGLGGDEGPATAAPLGRNLWALAPAPDGSVYVAHEPVWGGGCYIRRVDPSGIITTIAGDPDGCWDVDGVPATTTYLDAGVQGLTVDHDGNIYVHESYVIRRIGRDGFIWRVAGDWEAPENTGDGGPALAAGLGGASAMTTDRSGNLFFIDEVRFGGSTIRRVDASGVIDTIAGTGAKPAWNEAFAEGRATEVPLEAQEGNSYLACDEGGSLYLSTEYRIVRIDSSGNLRTIAGCPAGEPASEGALALDVELYPCGIGLSPKGDVVFVDALTNVYWRIDATGHLRGLARDVHRWPYGWGQDLLFAAAPDGRTFLGGGYSKVVDVLEPGLDSSGWRKFASKTDVASTLHRRQADGTYERRFRTGEVHRFDAEGRLTAVVDVTGLAETYVYDDEGRPVEIIDPAGLRTSLEYGLSGRLSAVHHPQGVTSRVTVDDRGDLTAVEDPDGSVSRYVYDLDHRLVAKVDPAGHRTTYRYDSSGRVVERAFDNGEKDAYVPLAAVGTDLVDGEATLVSLDALKASGTNAKGASRSLQLNDLGLPTQMTDTAGFSTLYQYDDRGLPTGRIDPTGRYVGIDHDEYGNVVGVTEPAIGAQTTVEYDPSGARPVRVTDPLGNVMTLTYDEVGLLARTTDALGSSVALERDARGLVVAITDPRGGVTRFDHDAQGNIVRVVDALGNATTLQRDGAGNVVARVAPDGATTRFEFDAMNRVRAVVDALGNRTTFGYETAGCSGCGASDRVTTITTPRGATTTLTYDHAGRVTTVRDPAGAESHVLYDETGLPVERTDADGTRVRWAHDARGLMVSQTLADGGVWRHEHDAAGRRVATIDPKGRRTEFTHDEGGRLAAVTKISAGRSLTTTYGYDLLGSVVSVTDPLGRTSLIRRDALGRPVEMEDPAGNLTRRFYDEAGNLVEYVDPRGNAWQWTHDALGRVLRETDPLGNATVVEYTAVGTILTSTDPRGMVTSYTHDPLRRPVSVIDGDGVTATYAYDPDGSVTGVSTSDGLALTRHFDLTGRMTGQDLPYLGRRLSYEYTAAGRLAARTVDDLVSGASRQTRYEWDSVGRLSRILPPVGDPAVYIYGRDGSRSTALLPGGTVARYGWSDEGWLASLRYETLSGTTPVSFAYEHDDGGRVVRITDHEGVTDLGYDALDRLTTADYPDGTWERFAFDEGGNRTRHEEPAGVTVYAHDAADRETSATGHRAATRTWDPAGNLLTETTVAGTTTNEWDARGRLRRSTLPDGRASTFRYGPASNQLLAATDPSGLETRFLRDGGDVVEDLDATNALLASYVDNPLTLDEHIARVSPAGVHTYLTDPVGSVRAIVDGTGAVRSTYSYRAFGEVRALSEGVPNPYRFAGLRWDPDLQRHYARARWYDQGLGRFSARDPWAPGQPSYLYAGGSPYMFTDPSGEFIFAATAAMAILHYVGLVMMADAVTSLGGEIFAEAEQTYEGRRTAEEAALNGVNLAAEGAMLLGGPMSQTLGAATTLTLGVLEARQATDCGENAAWNDAMRRLIQVLGVKAAQAAAGHAFGYLDRTLRETRGGGAGLANTTLPRAPDGRYLPDPAATGAHTRMGVQVSKHTGPYGQGATFDAQGNFLGVTDLTDHARPWDHKAPHWHPATSPNGVERGFHPIPSLAELGLGGED